MDLTDRTAVITGGAGGIGSATAEAFLAAGASDVTIVDLDPEAVASTATRLGCVGVAADVTDEAQVAALIEATLDRAGPIDVFFSNAGAGASGGVEADNDAWQQQWELHVMAHVYASRAVLPSMVARGEGYLIHTASAAGLLAAVGSAPYSVTKAACIKLAEWESITYGDDGIRVSVLAPQGVNTAMAPRQLGDGGTDGIIEASEVADAIVATMADERFFVLPHPEVGEYVIRKATDPDRWLGGMRRLRARSLDA
ncbi:MAG: SDR family oxidoreductase [Acidimicrobiales bacterium]